MGWQISYLIVSLPSMQAWKYLRLMEPTSQATSQTSLLSFTATSVHRLLNGAGEGP